MDEKLDGFVFYRSYFEAIRTLSEKNRLKLYDAIIAFALDGDEPAIDGFARTCFELIRPTLTKCRRKAISGRAGGKANNKQTTSEGEADEKQTTSKNEAIKDKGLRIKDKGQVIKDKGLRIKDEGQGGEAPPTPPRAARQRPFSRPSVEEVDTYCRQRGNGLDARQFVDFYSAKGWKVGNTPMKDWQAAVRTWERREAEQVCAQSPPREDNRYSNLQRLYQDALAEEEGAHDKSGNREAVFIDSGGLPTG